MKKCLKVALFALPLVLLLAVACEKEPSAPVYRAPYEKELWFTKGESDSIESNVVLHYADDTACKRIYLVVKPDNNYMGYDTKNITALCNKLKTRVSLSDKVCGKGNFHFMPGMVSKEDSIWFVQNGWTVNTPPL